MLNRTSFPKITDYILQACLLLLCYVSISNLQAQCTLACNNSVQVSLNNTGFAVITPSMVLESMPSCELEVQIVDANNQSIGSTLDCAYVNQTLNVGVFDVATGNSCWTELTLHDYIPPTISCTDIFIYCHEPYHPDSIGYPLVTDNCSNLDYTDLTYVDNEVNLDCYAAVNSVSVTAQIERLWSVTDASGLTTTCTQIIYLKNILLGDIVFPENQDGFDGPKLDCSLDDPNDLSIAGQPTAFGRPLENMGFCELVLTSTDLSVSTCGNAERVLREWKVINWCTGNTVSDIQILDMADQTAPTISCPSDITVSTDSYTCTASVTLPNPTVTDDCSSVNTVPSWQFGNGFGPFPDIPLGTHLVTYTSTDDCGNQANCTILLTVEDQQAPVAICNNVLNIGLQDNGMVRVYASSFDDGSNDNCTLDRIAVSRDGVDFGDYVEFTCSDIHNNPTMIAVRAYDTNDLFNTCTTSVNVMDNIHPTIDCPSDITIQCTQDYTDLLNTGNAFASDNCSIDTLYYEDSPQLDANCGTGIVYRQWFTKDSFGQHKNCTQVITLEDNAVLEVQFPADITIDLCQGNTTPVVAGEPISQGDFCKNLAMTHTDQVFSLGGNCSMISREWLVVDWCTYQPNTGSDAGRYTHTQWIQIIDTDAPVLQCLTETIVLDTSTTCSAIWVQIAPVNVIDCDTLVSVVNDSPYAEANGIDASGYYPQGSHVINYMATDFCGNNSTCAFTLHIQDGKAPTVQCVDSLHLSLDANGNLTLLPSQIDAGSTDNCTHTSDLTMSVFPNQFDCTQLGFHEVSLVVIDQAGNQDSCIATVLITDDLSSCAAPSVLLEGRIHTPAGAFVDLVELKLTGDTSLQKMTNLVGDFSFTGIQKQGNYTLTPQKDHRDDNGVSTFDIVLIQQHVLGISDLDSPYKIIAADVNNDGSVSTFDIVQIRQLILFQVTAFPNSHSWRFIKADYIFPNPLNPFTETFPEVIHVQNLTADQLNADFVAIKIGDVNGDASPNLAETPVDERTTAPPLQLQINPLVLEQGQAYEIPIYARNFEQIVGFQMDLQFDKQVLDLVDIQIGDLANLNANNFGSAHLAEGILSVSWDNISGSSLDKKSPLFSLILQAKQNSSLQDVLSVFDRQLVPEAYTSDLAVLPIELTWTAVPSTHIAVYPNYPNPFVASTTIPFDLVQSANVTIQVFDSKGVLLWTDSALFPAGEQAFVLERSRFLEGKGILFYRISVEGVLFFSGKMVSAN